VTAPFIIDNRLVGPDAPVYIIAELSANHHQNIDVAFKLIEVAKKAGADAIKLQTYTADTLTIDSHQSYFQVKGTLWDGRTLYDLYSEAYTPWDWQPKLKQFAEDMGMDLFSSPFDSSAVTFLETMQVPAYKIASFEIVDIPLLQTVARTGKPIIMSTGMATLAEIDEAVSAIRSIQDVPIVLLKCTSAYPAPLEEMNLRTIPHLAQAFGTPVGLSDHSMGIEVPVAAVTLGACVIEKHLTLSRDVPGPDSAFSLEPAEFKAMVDAVRGIERALGHIQYGVESTEAKSRVFRRSLFVVKDMKAGDTFSADNVRSIRPAHGLHTRYLPEVIGRQAKSDIESGTPLDWNLIA